MFPYPVASKKVGGTAFCKPEPLLVRRNRTIVQRDCILDAERLRSRSKWGRNCASVLGRTHVLKSRMRKWIKEDLDKELKKLSNDMPRPTPR